MDIYTAPLEERGKHFNKYINYTTLNNIFVSLRREGIIETGHRFWIMDHITTIFMYLRDIDGLGQYLRDLAEHSEKPLSCIEKTREERDNYIPIIIDRVMCLHRKNLKGEL